MKTGLLHSYASKKKIASRKKILTENSREINFLQRIPRLSATAEAIENTTLSGKELQDASAK
jgi:hypothetical protein